MAELPTGDEYGQEIAGHSYDGIQEYDNPTPGWWHVIFLGTILFGISYASVVHMSPMWPTRDERYAAAEAKALEAQFAELQKIPMGEEKILRIMGQPKWLDMGHAVFEANCVLCHKADGSGLVGPNMTDDYYKNVKTLADFIVVIENGAADGAMPAQKTILNENEIALVAAYEASLRGKNLPGKEPEGEQIPPFPEPITEETPAGG
ncbi:MAG: cbb3-type cytochrome c oxidase N-terminal domain-containing protein [Phycisphaerales bacterium]